MIINDTLKCCELCEHIDLETAETIYRNCAGKLGWNLRVYCEHMKVCKRYLEEKEKEMDAHT